MKYVLKGSSKFHSQAVFYTGRAGMQFISTSEFDAFVYETYERAQTRADRLNEFESMTGVFLAVVAR